MNRSRLVSRASNNGILPVVRKLVKRSVEDTRSEERPVIVKVVRKKSGKSRENAQSEKPECKTANNPSVSRNSVMTEERNEDPIASQVNVLEKNDKSPSSPLQKSGAHPINYLPLEILRIVLKYLPFNEQMNACLVCKSWCQECTRTFGHHVKICLTSVMVERDSSYLVNCRFERLSMTLFGEFKLHENVWRKIGSKFYELKLDGCRVTDQLIDKVPAYCDNLRFLQLHLSVGNFAFRTDAILQRMKRICRKLKTIDIVVLHSRPFTEDEFVDWRNICNEFNLTSCLNRAGKLACRISIFSEVIDESKLVANLRHFLRVHKIMDYSVNLNGRK